MLLPDLLIKNRYRIQKRIGLHAGMSEVWVARDEILDREVVIKTLNLKMLTSQDNPVSILENEVKIGAKLTGHPNILITLDYGKEIIENIEYAFIISEYVDGINLDEFVKKFHNVLDEETYYYISLFISWEILKAIYYTHKKGILHRDIKPLNIFISKFGTTKIGDFGLSKFLELGTRTHTLNGILSFPYCAPEQFRNEKLGKDTDIYQLACSLYQVFTGEYVFNVNSNAAFMHAHLIDNPRPLKEINPLVSDEISDIILGMLSKDPIDRTPLWRLNDVIGNELQKKFELEIEVDKDDEKAIKKVCDITDFPDESLSKYGIAAVDFPDFNELCSEAIQMLCEGFTSFKILEAQNN